MIHSLLLVPEAKAQAARLGVVKSPDNQRYWLEITKRLQSVGIDYCVIDWSKVQQASDLGRPQLLFLPNIEQLNASQLAALETWISQGGQVIVSGPVGVLAQPDIRNQLRSLLGAYWGVSLEQPSKLAPSPTQTPNWLKPVGVTNNIQGGVIIPTEQNAATAAVWTQRDNAPAVVTTNQATFLGWQWGSSQVAPLDADRAWLQAVLRRYALTPNPLNRGTNPYQSDCASQGSIANQRPMPFASPRETEIEQARTPAIPNQVAQVDPDFGVAPARGISRTGPLTPAQVAAMSQELKHLIGRVESALLTANAANSNVELATGTAVEQFLMAAAKGDSRPNQPQTSSVNPSTSASSQAVMAAKAKLQNFLTAAAQKDYNTARQQWIEARRLLWENYPTDYKLTQPEIRAIWLDRGTIVRAKSEQDLAKIFDRLAAAGFNTVFFETVNASYPIYPSRVAPEQNPLVKGWDPLGAAVKLAHERNMELHAWVWIFAAANQRHNAILNQPANYPGPVLKANPDWAVVDKQGRLFDRETKKAFFDPANPEVQRYLLALLEEIATRYPVDGIQLDYIRYPFQDPRVNQTYGYGKVARQRFKQQTGVDPIRIFPNNRDLWQKWTEFRMQQIDGFVATVSNQLRQKRPSLILSAAVFPLPRPERLQRLQQNWEDWAMRGDIDLVVPMTYALDTSGLESLAQPVLRQSTLSSALILPGIRLLNLPNMVAIDQIQHLRDSSAGGYALFAVENLNGNLSGIFNRTQGMQEAVSSASPSPIPYRQPLKAAAARYAALQREWSFLLAHNQMAMREPALSQWAKQADTLSTLLNQLAAEPTPQNLLSAKTFLISFRSQFQGWMRSQAMEQPYQVQVWANRLAAIERLLHYGERTVLNSRRSPRSTPQKL